MLTKEQKNKKLAEIKASKVLTSEDKLALIKKFLSTWEKEEADEAKFLKQLQAQEELEKTVLLAQEKPDNAAKKVGVLGAEIIIIKGDKGDPGEPGDSVKGDKGDPGYSPRKGLDYFDGKPGKPGKPGYTPVKGLDYFDGIAPDAKVIEQAVLGQIKIPPPVPGKNGSPDTGEQIVEKINKQDGKKIKASRVEGYEELKKSVNRRGDNFVAGSWGHQIQDEGTALTQEPIMNFVGSGVTVTDSGGKTVVTIPGGSGNFTDNEVVAGSGTTFTLAATPVVGSVHLYLRGQRATPGGVDYTISGTAITTINTWSAGDILADYRT